MKWKDYLKDPKPLENAASLRVVKKYLHQRSLWRVDRETVAKGVAIGLFAAFIPLIPFQMLIAAILAILLRANFIIAVLVSWVNNPITFLPIFYLVYYVGNLFVSDPSTHTIIHEVNWKFASTQDTWGSFSAWIVQFGKSFFIGVIIVSLSAAIIGYFLGLLIWYGRSYIKSIKHRK